MTKHCTRVFVEFKNVNLSLTMCTFEEPDVEIKLSDEIQGSLRLLKVKLNIYNINLSGK